MKTFFSSPVWKKNFFSLECSIQKDQLVSSTIKKEEKAISLNVIGDENLSLEKELVKWMDLYLKGTLPQNFTLPFSWEGVSFFQQSVLEKLAKVPFGTTCSYQDLAKEIGKEKGPRAVGAALRKNPFPLLLPCHRVIGSNGNLTGFLFGIPLKKDLLSFESSF